MTDKWLSKAFFLRLLAAAAGGFAVFSSYQPLGWWLGGLLGVALLAIALAPWGSAQKHPSLQQGLLLAFVFTLVDTLFMLPWVGEFVGSVPYLGLCFTLAIYASLIGLGGVAILAQIPPKFAYFGFAAWYAAVEWAISSFPFGGFAWIRLAWGQVDGPLAAYSRVGGPALVGFITVLVAAGLIARRIIVPAIVLGLSLVLSIAWIDQPATPLREVKVAAIQGNVPRLGLDFNSQRRAVLANHVRQTAKLEEPVDIIIWPENSSDVNPFQDAAAATLIQEATNKAQAPILVGTITVDEVGSRNTMLVVNPDQELRDLKELAPDQYHYKKFLQPFGEWMPWRKFFRLFSPYVDQAGNFKPGTGNGLINIGGVPLGVATCYEVIVDSAYRDAVLAGAQLLATPTNNATFGFGNMTYQQLAMSRMRAIELDRSVVIAATSGASAIVLPNGKVTQQTKIFEATNLVETLPLKDTITPAARFGFKVQALLAMIGAVFAAWSLFKWRSQSTRRQTR
ncbi:apolipoprotein N-acyltransferase [Corynebacterium caspium]|uniref:apolipoprotein N-acyltransferase n=1 Tax=Corynebacterium caspium TaxID=234828 RepID=UPI00037F0C0C|nr:apolipoprotein N-acyltransferase [Corynebacterium caspium]WKD59312.1 Apolipoprotein N-acyltransferase [Corynebacterium caspium DSM 44850]